jgi:hypothetical protein
MTDCVLQLIVSPAVEDAVVDWLLERDDVPGFSSMPIAGHGSSERSMTLAEQVAGRRRQVMFFIHLSAQTADSLLRDLRKDFRGSGMHYWLTPAIAFGHID